MASVTESEHELRRALDAGDDAQAVRIVSRLADAKITETSRVDLAERAAIRCSGETLSLIIDTLQPAYLGWAYALALRAANAGAARELARRGCDLLADPPDLAGEPWTAPKALARHDLTRSSAGLLRDAFLPSVSSEALCPPAPDEALVGGPFQGPFDLKSACRLIGDLMRAGAFDSVVTDDLFRAALAEAALCRADPCRHGADGADTCLALAADILALHRTYGHGSAYLGRLAKSLVRSDTDRRILAFFAREMPEALLARLPRAAWLRRDTELVRELALSATELDREQAGALVRALAEAGAERELARVLLQVDDIGTAARTAATDAAVAAGELSCALALVADARRHATPHPLEWLLP